MDFYYYALAEVPGFAWDKAGLRLSLKKLKGDRTNDLQASAQCSIYLHKYKQNFKQKY